MKLIRIETARQWAQGLVRRLGTSAAKIEDGNPRTAWEAKAAKEAKGGDPYKILGATNNDVGVKKFGIMFQNLIGF